MAYFAHRIEVDTHVHTMLSGHSWSSLSECVAQARLVGLKGFCLTEHSASTPNGPPEFLPHSMSMVPDVLDGVRIYHGLEADILNGEGALSPCVKYLSMLEFVIASSHVFDGSYGLDGDGLTQAYCWALADPYVCILGHIDTPGFPCDMEAVVKEAGRLNKFIELNVSALNPRRHKDPAAFRRLMALCKQHNVQVCVASDAHFHLAMGDFAAAMEMLEETRFPLELIVNYSFEVFDAFIEARRTRLGVDFASMS